MKILIWNIYKGKKELSFEQEFLKFAQDKDLLLLQEVVDSPEMISFWSDHFPNLHWEISRSFRMLQSLSHTGVGLGFHSKPQWIEYLKTESRELFLFTPKSSIIAELSFQGQSFLVICTHLLNFVPTPVFSKSLYQLASRVASYKGPMIFAGDFNTWNYKRYLILKNIMKDLNLEHVEFSRDDRALKLDHLFVRGFNVLQSLIHHEVQGSDHFPIEAEVAFTSMTPSKSHSENHFES